MSEPQRHLLVVDDDDRIRGLLREYLARAGFRVTTAPDAAAARRILEQLTFDLAVFDLMMPGEDGLSLTRWVRERQAVPILILLVKAVRASRAAAAHRGYSQADAEPRRRAPQSLHRRSDI